MERMAGLIYRGGYLIEDLSPVVSFEEVAYLLWNGRAAHKTQLDALCRLMSAARRSTTTPWRADAMDAQTDLMDTLRTAFQLKARPGP